MSIGFVIFAFLIASSSSTTCQDAANGWRSLNPF